MCIMYILTLSLSLQLIFFFLRTSLFLTLMFVWLLACFFWVTLSLTRSSLWSWIWTYPLDPVCILVCTQGWQWLLFSQNPSVANSLPGRDRNQWAALSSMVGGWWDQSCITFRHICRSPQLWLHKVQKIVIHSSSPSLQLSLSSSSFFFDNPQA